jgi:hypothetical protein
MAAKLRHELKHVISLADCFALRARLRVIADYDDHAGADGKYKVRSLYFDNPDDLVLKQKLDGINSREKFRIRYYNNDPSYIRLEKKIKVNGLCSKQSVQLCREQCGQIVHGEIRWMRDAGEPLLLELFSKMQYQMLKPRTVVDYEREAFVYRPGNVRVTIDSRIRTGVFSTDLFNQYMPVIPTGQQGIVTDQQGMVILEVKYDEFLPDIIADTLQIPNRQQSPFSKYAAARIFG